MSSDGRFIILWVIAAAHTTIDYIASWATFGTAFGTIGLAVATFVLALKTRALAQSSQETADAAEQELVLLALQLDAAQRQSEAAEVALNASLRPLVIDVPRHTMKTIQVQQQPGAKHAEEVDLSAITSGIGESPRAGRLMVLVETLEQVLRSGSPRPRRSSSRPRSSVRPWHAAERPR